MTLKLIPPFIVSARNSLDQGAALPGARSCGLSHAAASCEVSACHLPPAMPQRPAVSNCLPASSRWRTDTKRIKSTKSCLVRHDRTKWSKS
jgi:hypothetical protein